MSLLIGLVDLEFRFHSTFSPNNQTMVVALNRTQYRLKHGKVKEILAFLPAMNKTLSVNRYTSYNG